MQGVAPDHSVSGRTRSSTRETVGHKDTPNRGSPSPCRRRWTKHGVATRAQPSCSLDLSKRGVGGVHPRVGEPCRPGPETPRPQPRGGPGVGWVVSRETFVMGYGVRLVHVDTAPATVGAAAASTGRTAHPRGQAGQSPSTPGRFPVKPPGFPRPRRGVCGETLFGFRVAETSPASPSRDDWAEDARPRPFGRVVLEEDVDRTAAVVSGGRAGDQRPQTADRALGASHS